MAGEAKNSEKAVVLHHNPDIVDVVHNPELMFALNKDQVVPVSSSLFVLSATNPFRLKLVDLVNHVWFKRVVMTAIIANCIALCWDNPLNSPDSLTSKVLAILEYVFLSFFALEVVIKILAMGLLFHKNAYLRSTWNMIDFAAVAMGFLQYLPGFDTNLSFLRALRVFRSLRALQALRITIQATVTAFKMMADIVLLSLFVLILFGILGMQLFSGRMKQKCFNTTTGLLDTSFETLCTIGATSGKYMCPSGTACLAKAENPNRGTAGFDNIFLSWLTILQSASLEGWIDNVYYLFETDTDYFLSVAYFIGIVGVVGFFVLQLVTTLVYVSFVHTKNEQEDENNIEELLKQETIKAATKGQVEMESLLKNSAASPQKEGNGSFVEVAAEVNEEQPKPADAARVESTTSADSDTENQERKPEPIVPALLPVVQSCFFRYFFLGCIVVNGLLLASFHHGQPDSWTKALQYCGYAFTGLFVIEMILKFLGLGWRKILFEPFNLFDLLIVILSVVDLILDLSTNNSTSANFSAFRLMRLLRLVNNIKLLKKVITIMAKTVPTVLSLAVLLSFFTFFFSYIGVQLFAGKMKDEEGEIARLNFDSFSWGLVTVFVVITGENWNAVMADLIGVHGVTGALFIVPMFVFGNYLVLNLFMAMLLAQYDEDHDEQMAIKKQKRLLKRAKSGIDEDEEEIRAAMTDEEKLAIRCQGSALGLSEKNPIRKCAIFLVQSKLFNSFILLIIFLSTLLLAFDDIHLKKTDDLYKFMEVWEYIATSIFVVEMIIKIFAVGLILKKGAYLRDIWDILDFILVAFSVIGLVSQGVGVLKVFRSFRCLRPIRALRGNESLKASISALGHVFVEIVNILLTAIFFYFLFAIFGMHLFSGQFYQCEDASGAVLPHDKTACLAASTTSKPLLWRNPDLANFDNIAWAFLAIFEISSMEMWPDVMLRAVDTNGIDKAAVRDNYMGYSVFFLVLIVFGNLLVMNLFVGAVCSTFQDVTAKMTGRDRFSEDEESWYQIHRNLMMISPERRNLRPRNKVLAKLYDVVQSFWFEVTVTVCILLNVLVMCMEYHNAPTTYSNALSIANDVFTYIYIAEMVVKLIGLGPQYFASGWNIFDFLITNLSWIGGLLNVKVLASGLLRVLRIGRVFRMLKVGRAAGVKALVRTLMLSLPSLINTALILFFLHFLFAVIGMSLFKGLPRAGKEFLTDHSNFDTFSTAMLTLFRATTGESYNGIMHDCMYFPVEHCPATGACGSYWAIPFWISFLVISQYTVLNLVVAAIVDEFAQTKSAESQTAVVPTSDLQLAADLFTVYSLPTAWYNVYNPKNIDSFCISLVNLRKYLADCTCKLALDEKQGNVGSSEDIAALQLRAYAIVASNTVVQEIGGGEDRVTELSSIQSLLPEESRSTVAKASGVVSIDSEEQGGILITADLWEKWSTEESLRDYAQQGIVLVVHYADLLLALCHACTVRQNCAVSGDPNRRVAIKKINAKLKLRYGAKSLQKYKTSGEKKVSELSESTPRFFVSKSASDKARVKLPAIHEKPTQTGNNLPALEKPGTALPPIAVAATSKDLSSEEQQLLQK
mmetsp:Transcript_36766/g.72162  ORF Transcript_36766/g.72162 Transcript_36766/m.72162 type:complete len:1575 (+) Transcript_36766:44-4768(+)